MKSKQKKEDVNKYLRKGVSMMEALILIFVFSVVTISFYSVFSIGSRYILSSKNKILAISLANEEMEKLRNLPYDSVALQAGIPSGSIDPDKVASLEGKDFHVITDIRYYDDPDDGVFGGSPDDNVPNDYKVVEVFIYWGGETESERTTLSSRFVPPGVENSVGGGTFSINAIDYAGNPVPSVSVNIFNDQLSPVINYSTHTDVNGNLLLQGVPADNVQNYRITMSKSGYETVVTYSPLTAGFIPEDGHSNIIAGALNEKTIIIDLLSDLTIESKDFFGTSIGEVDFTLIGGRRMDDGTVSPGVYSYNQSVGTDSSGEFSIDDINSGKYILSDFAFASGNYRFLKVETGDDLVNTALNLLPGADFNTHIIFADEDLDSAYIKVKDSNTDSVIAGASVKLSNITLGYDVTRVTDKYGYVYFPESLTAPLQNGAIYDIEVTATTYNNNTSTITINKFTDKEIALTSI